MNYRGPGYFGPLQLKREWEEHVDTPVGAVCVLCEELVDTDDTGTINPIGQVMHYECVLRAAVGSIGHQAGLCSCYGGTAEDPPGMTRRQAAVAAVEYFMSNGHP